MALNETVKQHGGAVLTPPADVTLKQHSTVVFTPPADVTLKQHSTVVFTPPADVTLKQHINVVIHPLPLTVRERKAASYAALKQPQSYTRKSNAYAPVFVGSIMRTYSASAYGLVKYPVKNVDYKSSTYALMESVVRVRDRKGAAYAFIARPPRVRGYKTSHYAILIDPNVYMPKQHGNAVVHVGPFAQNVKTQTNVVLNSGDDAETVKQHINVVVYDPAPRVFLYQHKIAAYGIIVQPPPVFPIKTHKAAAYGIIEERYWSDLSKASVYAYFETLPTPKVKKTTTYAVMKAFTTKIHNYSAYALTYFDGDFKQQKTASYALMYEHPPVKVSKINTYLPVTPPTHVREYKTTSYAAMAVEASRQRKGEAYGLLRAPGARSKKNLGYAVIDNLVWSHAHKASAYAAIEYAQAPNKTRKLGAYSLIEKPLDKMRVRSYGLYITIPPERIIARQHKATAYSLHAPVLPGVNHVYKANVYFYTEGYDYRSFKINTYAPVIEVFPFYVRAKKLMPYILCGPPTTINDTSYKTIRTRTS